MKEFLQDLFQVVLPVVIIVGFLVGLGYCVWNVDRADREWEEAHAKKPYQQMYSMEELKITESYDAHDRLLIKEIYNTETKITTTYNYIYNENGWGTATFSKVQVFTVDENGKIISQTEQGG
jgi:hypothetical protein